MRIGLSLRGPMVGDIIMGDIIIINTILSRLLCDEGNITYVNMLSI